MKHIMARYKVKKEKLGEVILAIKEFVEEVNQKETGTLKYEAFCEPVFTVLEEVN